MVRLPSKPTMAPITLITVIRAGFAADGASVVVGAELWVDGVLVTVTARRLVVRQLQ